MEANLTPTEAEKINQAISQLSQALSDKAIPAFKEAIKAMENFENVLIKLNVELDKLTQEEA